MLKVISKIVLLVFFIAGVFMASQTKTDSTLENFDKLWALGDPVIIEKKFNEILPQARSLEDKSIYLQIMSQIALTQALQKKFNEAHKTLDDAEALLTPEYDLARVRILLERGRIFQQAEKISEARRYFEQAFELSKKNNFDYHTINAAHMIAIVAEKVKDKIKWNQLAIDLATNTKEAQARDWLGPLYNNLGQNYIEDKQFEKALDAFQKALVYRKKENYIPNIRVAQWAIGRTLRFLNRLDEALDIQLSLCKEYAAIIHTKKYDVPVEMFKLVCALVYEELAEIYNAKTKHFAKLAYNDLSNDEMFQKTEPDRLERLKQLQRL
jgi:tetratricopeptide (TPR) repeat protein